MNIIINDADNMAFTCLDDLANIIPKSCDGKVVNYGQGEGQIEIEDSIWGIYYNGENCYHLQYE